MKHSQSNELSKTLRVYSSGKQQKALYYLLEYAATHWSMDAQDVSALLGLDMPDLIDGNHCASGSLISPSTQRSLFELIKLFDLLSSMPRTKAYNRSWLMTPNSMLGDMAPIDLILADTVKGVSQLRSLLSCEDNLKTKWETAPKQSPLPNVNKPEVKMKPGYGSVLTPDFHHQRTRK